MFPITANLAPTKIQVDAKVKDILLNEAARKACIYKAATVSEVLDLEIFPHQLGTCALDWLKDHEDIYWFQDEVINAVKEHINFDLFESHLSQLVQVSEIKHARQDDLDIGLYHRSFMSAPIFDNFEAMSFYKFNLLLALTPVAGVPKPSTERYQFFNGGTTDLQVSFLLREENHHLGHLVRMSPSYASLYKYFFRLLRERRFVGGCISPPFGCIDMQPAEILNELKGFDLRPALRKVKKFTQGWKKVAIREEITHENLTSKGAEIRKKEKRELIKINLHFNKFLPKFAEKLIKEIDKTNNDLSQVNFQKLSETFRKRVVIPALKKEGINEH